MKKYLLLCTALTVASSAYAALDCATPLTCAEWGFTMSTDDCAGKFVLRCPREPNNDNAVFCEKEKTCEEGGYLSAKPSEAYTCEEVTFGNKGCYTNCYCPVGSILYNNLKCYTSNDAPAISYPIAVVFDATNKLAIGLENADTLLTWAANTSENVSSLSDYTTSSAALAETTTGKQNTTRIVALGGNYASSSYAPGYCYNLTTGGQAKGSWFLPNLKELKAIYDNKTTLNTAFTSTGGTALAENTYWTSTEYNANNAWILVMSNGHMSGNGKNMYNFIRCALSYSEDNASTDSTEGDSAFTGPNL